MSETQTENITALLIDTMSIQRYIYSSSKLKINLGASYIVATFFEEILKKIDSTLDTTKWKESDFTYKTLNGGYNAYIGYIGGGNALLFFDKKDNAEEFIKAFSLKLIELYPGLIINYGIHENFDLKEYSNSITELFDELNTNKNKFIPSSIVNRLPIADICTYDYYAANSIESNEPVSTSAETKLDKTTDGNNLYQSLIPKQNENTYSFPTELEKIGFKKDEGHLAVVHIDGNGIGKLFQNITSLGIARQLSVALQEVAEAAFKDLVDKNIIGNQFIQKKISDNILPIRPIIIGGDDITFICEGTIGIYLAEKYIEYFTAKANEEVKKIFNGGDKDLQITACAGIAIVKRKFPFAKAYQLSEDLCQSAKKFAKAQKDGAVSALDYHIANTGFAGSWDEIKFSYYQFKNKNLRFSPYLLNDDAAHSISTLKAGRQYYQNWPKNKLADLKEILWATNAEQEIFIEENKIKGNNLFNKEEKIKFEDKLANGINCTPIYDQIELIDFYPSQLLTLNKEQNAKV